MKRPVWYTNILLWVVFNIPMSGNMTRLVFEEAIGMKGIPVDSNGDRLRKEQ